MDPLQLSALVSWLTIHLGALISAWGTRVSAGSRWEVPLQIVSFMSMAAVGTAAWVGIQYELSLWLPSGGTLVGMVLIVVIADRRQHDMRPARHSAAQS